MFIEIKDNFTNEVMMIKNVNYKYIENKLSYVYNAESYIWTFNNKEILLEKKGEIEYLHKYIEGKLTESIIKMNALEMKVYILTKSIIKVDSNIKLMYNIYNDRDVKNLISSYEVKINL